MPKYAFECENCRVRFERTLKVGRHLSQPCPSCKEASPLIVSDFGFSFAEVEGQAPANSGVHQHDYPTADNAIGRSAQKRWAHIHEREKVKKEARAQGETPALIRHQGSDFIDYEPMSDVGRDARRKLVKDARTAMGKSKDDPA